MRGLFENQRMTATCYVVSESTSSLLVSFDLLRFLGENNRDICSYSISEIKSIAKDNLSDNFYNVFNFLLNKKIKESVRVVFYSRRLLSFDNVDDKVNYLIDIGIKPINAVDFVENVEAGASKGNNRDSYRESSFLSFMNLYLSNRKHF